MRIFFESEVMIVKYDSVKNIIIVVCVTPPVSEEYREGVSAVLRAIQELGTGKVVWDCAGLGTISPADQEWTIQNFHNPGLKYGYSQAAIVLPEDIFTHMSVDAMVNEAGDFKTKYFDNTPAAIEWVLQ